MDNMLVIQPLVALIAGILILIMPRLLNYVVAIYLIVIGVLGLWPQLGSLGALTQAFSSLSTSRKMPRVIREAFFVSGDIPVQRKFRVKDRDRPGAGRS